MQAAWYCRIAQAVFKKPARFGIIFVGKNKPFPAIPLMMSDDAVELGHRQIDNYIDKIKLGVEGKWSLSDQMKMSLLHLPDSYVEKQEAKLALKE